MEYMIYNATVICLSSFTIAKPPCDDLTIGGGLIA